jgi:hypothetical protein
MLIVYVENVNKLSWNDRDVKKKNDVGELLKMKRDVDELPKKQRDVVVKEKPIVLHHRLVTLTCCGILFDLGVLFVKVALDLILECLLFY